LAADNELEIGRMNDILVGSTLMLVGILSQSVIDVEID